MSDTPGTGVGGMGVGVGGVQGMEGLAEGVGGKVGRGVGVCPTEVEEQGAQLTDNELDGDMPDPVVVRQTAIKPLSPVCVDSYRGTDM